MSGARRTPSDEEPKRRKVREDEQEARQDEIEEETAAGRTSPLLSLVYGIFNRITGRYPEVERPRSRIREEGPETRQEGLDGGEPAGRSPVPSVPSNIFSLLISNALRAGLEIAQTQSSWDMPEFQMIIQYPTGLQEEPEAGSEGGPDQSVALQDQPQFLFTVVYYVLDDRPKSVTMEELDEATPEVEVKGDASGECPICLEGIVKGDQIRNLACRHVFHSTCVAEWVTNYANECPMCRKLVVTPLTDEEK